MTYKRLGKTKQITEIRHRRPARQKKKKFVSLGNKKGGAGDFLIRKKKKDMNTVRCQVRGVLPIRPEVKGKSTVPDRNGGKEGFNTVYKKGTYRTQVFGREKGYKKEPGNPRRSAHCLLSETKKSPTSRGGKRGEKHAGLGAEKKRNPTGKITGSLKGKRENNPTLTKSIGRGCKSLTWGRSPPVTTMTAERTKEGKKKGGQKRF